MTTGVLPSGTLLHKRYRVMDLIGSGGMGAVYLADDNRLEGRRCAVKETLPSPLFSPEAAAALRAQFHQEANILAQLDHPNLPKVSDFFSREDRDYLVMDFIDGPDLAHILAQARGDKRFLQEKTVLEWTRQLCDALSYMHHRPQPIVHRDVKPANIKLTGEGRVKLVDFGLVKPLDTSDPRTMTGLHGVGSLPYTPLEQYVEQMGHTDPRSDLYALGATLYHLLTGEMPPSAQDRFLDPQTLVPPRRINPDISNSTENAILAAMALHPQDRPAGIDDWENRWLDNLGDGAGSPAVPAAITTLAGPDADAGPSTLWGQVWSSNQRLILVAGSLLAAALAMTIANALH